MTRLTLFLLTLTVSAAQAQKPRVLTLREALELAQKLSPDIQLSRLAALEAEAASRNVRSAYQPQLQIAVSSAYQTSNLQGIGLLIPGFSDRIGPFRTFNARPVLTQTVLDLSLLSSIRAARERENERKFDIETTREATLLTVAQLYFQAQQVHSRSTAAEARRDTASAVFRQAEEFFKAGTASKLDVVRAEQQFQAETVAMIEANRDFQTLLTMLLRTIGMEQEMVALELKTWQPARQLDVPVNRPEQRAIESRLRSAALDEQAARRERYPRLAFAGDYGVLGAGPDRSLSTYSVGAQLSIPLWTSGRIQSAQQAARIRIDQAKAQQRATELRIAQEVKQARIEIDAAVLALASAEKGTAAAREALELSRLRFASGIATNLDTITAQGILAQAEDQEIRLRYEYLLARARYARAAGDVLSLLD
jgi:outer membrane protein TolC